MVRFIGRVFGWLLLAAALIILGSDLFAFSEQGGFDPLLLGEAIASLIPSALDQGQAVAQRYLLPWLWDPAMTWFLNQPVALIFAVTGMVLALALRPRERRRIFRA